MEALTQEAELVEALSEHTKVESAGDGGENGKVACWLTANAITGNRCEIVSNITLLAEAHDYEYKRGSLESSGYIVVFEPSDD